MSEVSVASEMFRPGLLEGVHVLVAGAGRAGQRGESIGAAVGRACGELGARVSVLETIAGDSSAVEEGAAEEGVEHAVEESARINLLIVDAAALFTAAGATSADTGHGGPRSALRACLEGTWSVTRAVANLAFLAQERAGRIVYVAPPLDAGEHADAARAGLENLARTLSVEWARHSITVVAIAPGGASSAGEVAALCAYLASPAGAYFSGCLLDLRARGRARGEEEDC